MKEPQTASELMMQSQMQQIQIQQAGARLPSEEVKQFLLSLVNQSNFPGQMAEFVAGVKALISTAEIR